MASSYRARTATTDYTGRTVDLLLLKTILEPVADKIVDPDVSVTPRIVTGIEKLVQRYALLFLTNLGSVKNCEDYGTEIIKKLGTGHIYNESTLQVAAAAANLKTKTTIINEDSATETPDDEALDNAEVLETSINRMTATVYVKVGITSKAGETFIYTTPLQTGI